MFCNEDITAIINKALTSVKWGCGFVVDRVAIGKQIKYYREKRHFTQAVLAEKLDVSESYISQIERGVAKISLKRLDEIAGFTGTTLRALVTYGEPDEKRYISEISKKIVSLPSKDMRRLLSIIDAYINFE